MEMLADPAPAIELIVPAGYRGQIKANIQVQADVPLTPGQRSFSYPVPPSGELVVTGPPLFKHVAPANVRVKFADNAPLTQWAKQSEIGYWLLKTEATTYFFLIGTQWDYDAYRRSIQPGGSHGSGQGGGQGKRGHRGNPSAGDSN
jgi:hypothetical protein